MCKELKPVAARWDFVGSALKLVADRIDTIRKDCKEVDECLRATITEWLNKNYNTIQYGEPSWKMLVQAVSDPSGGNNRALAEEIANRHGGTQSMFDNNCYT